MQLRYIIIPLLILLYIYWTYTTIKNIKYSHKHDIVPKFTSVLWFMPYLFSIMIGLLYGFICLMEYIKDNW